MDVAASLSSPSPLSWPSRSTVQASRNQSALGLAELDILAEDSVSIHNLRRSKGDGLDEGLRKESLKEGDPGSPKNGDPKTLCQK